MREIKFRGKSLDTGEWVYGHYYNMDDCRKGKRRHVMVFENAEECGLQTIHEPIDINTLGQYIGVRDKNGKQVYEGDILKDDNGKVYKIVWGHNLMWLAKTNETHCNCYGPKGISARSVIIGNIHDNPILISA